MAARENECQISQNDILHMKFSEFYLCFHNSCEFWHLFSRVPIRNCLWCYYRKLITSIVLENCKKNNAILFLLFWYKVFVHSVLKLFNFLVDSVLNSYLSQGAFRLPFERGAGWCWKYILKKHIWYNKTLLSS